MKWMPKVPSLMTLPVVKVARVITNLTWNQCQCLLLLHQIPRVQQCSTASQAKERLIPKVASPIIHTIVRVARVIMYQKWIPCQCHLLLHQSLQIQQHLILPLTSQVKESLMQRLKSIIPASLNSPAAVRVARVIMN